MKKLLFIFMMVVSIVVYADNNNPKFQDYKVEVFSGSLAKRIDTKGNEFAQSMRTVLQNGLKGGINFAGKYAIVIFGCGGGCIAGGVIDVETGKVIETPWLQEVSGIPPKKSGEAWQDSEIYYKKDSTLLVIKGSVGGMDDREGAFFLNFKNGKFDLIKEVKS